MSAPIHVVNIIHSLTFGGAARTMIATAKHSMKAGDVRHSLVMLDLQNTDPRAAAFALEEGLHLPTARNREELLQVLESADIVQVNWWQHPEMDEFLRSALPPMRLLGWFHCACDQAPQVLTDDLVALFDRIIGGSSYTYFAPALWRLSTEERLRKGGYVVGGADFSRLEHFQKLPHTGFRVGYIGTVNPVKMYGRYLEMHQGIEIPGFQAIVCGGDHHLILKKRAAELGLGELFDFRGYVDDVSSVLAECDAYGYPLCPDTYAASELNLQEVMYAGIPSVVFPHGGLKTLVIHDFNGLVVHTEREYREALRFLAENPAERERLGRNAAYYAREVFGAERNAEKMNDYYRSLMTEPKRTRAWRGYAAPGVPSRPVQGHERFLESLGEHTAPFQSALTASSLKEIIEAEAKILHSSPLMTLGSLLPYCGAFPEDPYLSLWGGLALLGIDRGSEGAQYLLQAHQLGLPSHPERIFAYMAIIAEQYDDDGLRMTSLERVRLEAPTFPYEELRALFATSLATRPSKRPL